MKLGVQYFILNVVLFLLLSGSLIIQNVSSEAPASLSYSAQQNYVITFINYNQSYVDINTVESDLPTIGGYSYPYQINYEFQFANSTYESDINGYIDSISTQTWTSALNSTALEEQKVNFGRKSIFKSQNGTGIDAAELENYLNDNPVSTSLPNDNRFFIYVFNLSRFDDLTNDHWFNVSEVDPDSGIQRFFWRLEWDYDLGNNFNVRFPYAGFTQNTEISLLDPTAFQWYLKWRKIWNYDTDPHVSYDSDLDHLISGLSVSAKTNMISDTVGTWLKDWIYKIYNMEHGSVGFFPDKLGTSVSVQMQVLYKGSESTKENLQWIVNDQLVEDTVAVLFQASSVDVQSNYIDLEKDSFMNGLFESAKVSYSSYQSNNAPFDDWNFYDGNILWYAVGGNSQLNTNYFNNNAANIIVKGLLYLVDNASYVGIASQIPWKGGLYTGLGGGSGQMTMLYELDRAFMADHVTKKSGLSRVLIHEIGHAVGIPHTFSNQGSSTFDTFTSDFATDVMGYYPGVSNYSEILIKLYHREAADREIGEIIPLYQSLRTSRSESSLGYVVNEFDKAIEAHRHRNYFQSYLLIRQAKLALLQDTTDPTESTFTSTTTTSTTSHDGSSTSSSSDITSPTSKSKENGFPSLEISIFVVSMIAIFWIRKKKYFES